MNKVFLKFQRDQPHDRFSVENYLFLLYIENFEDQGTTLTNEFFIGKGIP